MNNQRELERFLRQQLLKEREEPVGKLELRHAAPGAKGNAVDDFETSNISTDNIQGLTDEILDRAQHDANGLGGVQRYELIVLTRTGPSNEAKRSVARFAFRVRSEDDEDEHQPGDEPATTKGLLTQLMRHNEQQARTMMHGLGALVGQMSRRMEQDGKAIEALMDERTKHWQLLEQAKSEEHEREIALLEAGKKQERIDWGIEKINALIPIILSKMSGRPMMDSQEASMLRGFIDTISEEQFKAIASNLKPEQQIALFTLVKSLREDSKSQHALPNGDTSELTD